MPPKTVYREPQETDKPGLPDASVSDFLMPYLTAGGAAGIGEMMSGTLPKLAEETGSIALGGAPEELVNVGTHAGKAINVPKGLMDNYLKSIGDFEGATEGKELDFADRARELAHDSATKAAFKRAFPSENLGNDELWDGVRSTVGKFADDVMQKPEMMAKGGKVMKPETIEKEKDTDDWDEIKNWVGAANKDTKHPLAQEADRMKLRHPEHLDEGGVAGGVDLSQLPPAGTPPPISGTGSITPSPSGTVMPPAAPPRPDAAFSGPANSALGGITPEKLQALYQSVQAGRQRGQIGAGIAGIGDAIASIGGRTPEHMKSAEELIDKNSDMALKLPEQQAALGKEKYGLTKEMASDAPDSMRSYVAQSANAPLLKQLGFKPDEIKAIPASLIDGLRSGAITAEDARAQLENTAEFRKAQLAQGAAQIEATKEHQKDETKQGAAKALQERGTVQKVRDFISPSPETKTLEAQASGNSGSAIPDGRVTVISPDGKVGHIPQAQLKAALAKGYKQQ